MLLQQHRLLAWGAAGTTANVAGVPNQKINILVTFIVLCKVNVNNLSENQWHLQLL